MRNWALVLTTAIAGPVTRWTNVIKITRRDTQVFGFTSHLTDLTISGLLYRAEVGLDASPMQNSVGAGVDHLDIVGVVRSSRITAPDIRAGVWDAAEVEMSWCDWNDPNAAQGLLLTGTIGEIKESEGEFTAELRSLSQHYSQQIGKECSAMCRVKKLFGPDCFIVGGTNFTGTQTAATHRFNGAVVTYVDPANPRIMKFGGPTTPAGGNTKSTDNFKHGRVAFTTGNNAGFEMDVKQHVLIASEAEIQLQRAFPYAVQVNDVAMLETGCDRTLAQCRDRFSNAGNYQAEPTVPGSESILRVGRKTGDFGFDGLAARLRR